MIPEVLAGDLRLGHAALVGKLDGDLAEQAGRLHQAQSDRRPFGRQELLQLARDALAGQVADELGLAGDRRQGGRRDDELELGRQPDRADHPQGVLAEAIRGDPNGLQPAALEVGPSAERVDQRVGRAGDRAPGQGVHGEIAARQVLLDRRPELDPVGPPEIGVVVVAPERGDLVLDAVALDGHRAERVLVDRAREQGLEHLRPGVGRQVPVVRRPAQEDVAERAADHVGRPPVAPEDLENRLDRAGNPGGDRAVGLVRDQLRPRNR